MFRLTDFETDGSLFRDLSVIASQVIGNALEVWAGTPDRIRDIYLRNFWDTADGKADFFHGISLYLDPAMVSSERNASADEARRRGVEISADGRIGMELIARKVRRMKEKMDDSGEFYTFDLLEEYLFSLLLTEYDPSEYEDGEDPYVITGQKEIEETAHMLLSKYQIGKELAEELEEEDLEIEYTAWLATTVHCLDKMSLGASDIAGFDSLFFWDDDYSLFFEKSFLEGIQELISGPGSMMGYGYENVTEIFTDIGIRAPLMLVGSSAAFDARAQAFMEEHQKYMEKVDAVARTGFALPEDEDLPFG